MTYHFLELLGYFLSQLAAIPPHPTQLAANLHDDNTSLSAESGPTCHHPCTLVRLKTVIATSKPHLPRPAPASPSPGVDGGPARPAGIVLS